MADLSDRVDTLGRYLDIDGRRQQLAGLQAKRLEPGYWDDPEAAAATEQEISAETDWVEAFERLGASVVSKRTHDVLDSQTAGG